MIFLTKSIDLTIYLTICCLFLYILFLDKILNKKEHTTLFKYIFATGFFFTIALMWNFGAIKFFPFIRIIVFTVMGTIFYKGTISARLFWSTYFILIIEFIEFVSSYFLLIFAARTPDTTIGDKYLLKIYAVTFIVLSLLFTIKIILSEHKKINLTTRQTLILMMIAVFGIISETISLNYTSFIVEKLNDDQILNYTLLSNFFTLAFFAVSFYYIYQLGITNQAKNELTHELEIARLERRQYDDILELTRTLRELKHDMRFHLDTILGMADKNEYDRLAAYIQDYRVQIDEIHHLISSGNTAIDCILSVKLQAAEKNNVKMDYSILLPDRLPIQDIDSSVIIGNLMDNALEAAQKVPSPWIRFHIKPVKNLLSILAENSFSGVTTSKNSIEHGLGLNRVNELVEKYNGSMCITPDNDVFRVHILIPLENYYENEYHRD